MPYALLIFGTIALIAGVRDTQSDLAKLVKQDFTGSPSFIWWIVAMLIVGSLGYIKSIRPAANALLALVLIVLFIGAGKNSFFQKFTQEIGSGSSGSNLGVNTTSLISEVSNL